MKLQKKLSFWVAIANHGDFRNSSGEGEQKGKKAQAEKKSAKTTPTTGNLPSLSSFSPKFDALPNYEENATSGKRGQASQSNDHLKNIPISIETMVNSKEFVYYTYYQRIRQQIRQYWEPSIRVKVRKIFAEGRQIASTRDHITKVVIILNPQGSLQKIQVLDGSGVRDLDDAAIDAFRAAEPFPNPPKGIVDPDGTIKIRWDFVLESAQYLPKESSPQRVYSSQTQNYPYTS
jgi:protein TonB